MFAIAETHEFERLSAALPRLEGGRIRKKLRTSIYPALEQNPFSGPNIKRLVGFDSPTWRYRLGDYRIFYEVQAGMVIVTAIHRRRDAY